MLLLMGCFLRSMFPGFSRIFQDDVVSLWPYKAFKSRHFVFFHVSHFSCFPILPGASKQIQRWLCSSILAADLVVEALGVLFVFLVEWGGV